MSNKVLYVIIVLLLLVIVAGVIYLFSDKLGLKPEPVPSNLPVLNQPPANESLSEQPNKAKYNEYLSDIYLGKMAIGKMIGTDGFPTKTNVFTAGIDQFCNMMTLKKTIPAGNIAIAIYDTIAQQDNAPKTVFPMELKAGGSGGCGDLTQSAGKYEYKLYIDDVLAAVLPFEVR